MRLLVNLIIILLIFTFFILFVNKFIPAYKAYSISTQNKNEALTKLLKASLINKNLTNLLKKNEVSQIYATEQKGYFDFYLPKKFNDYDLILLINSIFRANGFVEPNTYNFNKEQIPIPNLENHKILKVTFNTSLEGRYEDIVNLIKTFENHSRIFKINSVKLIKKSNEGKNLIEADINISTFYMEE